MNLKKLLLIIFIAFSVSSFLLAADFEVGKEYNGFKLLEKKELKNINSKGYFFEHTVTKTKLFKLKNNDENKAFSITFKTLPYSDNGIAHVLEHSVLCGSEKFPVKSPFLIMSKGSMSTFLNAMTSSNYTMYPVASPNDKEFYNLMDVYLDAVLNPMIYKEDKILKQEGWAYKLENKDAPLKVSGVVYNEMKGALSSPDSLMWNYVQSNLLPGTTYSYESGGEPEAIRTITQKEFEEFHNKYYHPSNGVIYLYGDGNLKEELEFINKNYLSEYNYKDVDSKIKTVESFKKPVEKEYYYSISKRESTKNKTYHSLSWSIGEISDLELRMAFDILNRVLGQINGAPLKKALINSEIGKDVSTYFYDGIKQPLFTVKVVNSTVEKKEKFKKIIFDTLEKISKNGIDKNMLEAVLNSYEFRLREADFGRYPKGLVYNYMLSNNILFGIDPFKSLNSLERLEKIRNKAEKGYFENLIKEYLLNNNHRVLITLKPKKGMLAEKRKEINEKLQERKKNMSAEEIEEIVKKTEELKKYQMRKDSKEDLQKVPLLSLDDIKKGVKKINLKEEEIAGVKTYFYNASTNDIVYQNLYFDSSVVKKENIQYIELLTYLMGRLGTDKFDYEKFNNMININTGGIRVNHGTLLYKNEPSNMKPIVTVSSKAFCRKTLEMEQLLTEMLSNLSFDNKDRIKKLVSELRSSLERRMGYSGARVASSRLSEKLSENGVYNELIGGYKYLEFIRNIDDTFTKEGDKTISTLKNVYHTLFNRNNLQMGIVTEEKTLNKYKEDIANMINKLDNKKLEKNEYNFEIKKYDEGIASSGSRVQYVYMGARYDKLGYKYNGKLRVLSRILSRDYIHKKIRVMGGAYGGWNAITSSGKIYFGSYRDPNLKETVEVFKKIPEYLKNLDLSERQMTRYIIGAVSRYESPMSPKSEGMNAIRRKLSGITHDFRERIKKEILDTNLEDIKNFAGMIEDIINNSNIAAYGNTQVIEKNKNLFDSIIYINK